MISDMMDYTEIETGSINIEETNYSTASMISDIMTCGKYFAEKKDIEIRVNIDSEIPKMLHGDSARITRIFSNLLSNSVKYTDFGHIDVVIKWEQKSKFAGWINAEVTDTGIGLRDEDIARITSAFQRVDKKRNQHIQGLGLGLTIVTKLLAMMGSKLSITSEYGKGTSIKFRLMQGIVDPSPLGNVDNLTSIPEKNTLRAGFTAPDARLLAVDDNSMNLELYRGSLKDTKIQIDTAINGVEALELISRYKYDLIILDHMMPLMDGMETLKTIKKQNLCQGVPILVITANAVPGEKSVYLNAGFDDYLSKPFGMMEMVSRVKAVLRRTEKKEKSDILQAGKLIMNTSNHTVTANGERVQLTLKEYEILKKFIQNLGLVFTREHLLQSIWGVDYLGETRTVDVHIGTLRTKLGECGNYIQTVRGVGYRMEGQI